MTASPAFAFHRDASERPVSDVDPSFDQKMATGRNRSKAPVHPTAATGSGQFLADVQLGPHGRVCDRRT